MKKCFMVIALAALLLPLNGFAQHGDITFVMQQPDDFDGAYTQASVLTHNTFSYAIYEYSAFGDITTVGIDWQPFAPVSAYGYEFPFVIGAGLQYYSPDSDVFFFRDEHHHRFTAGDQLVGIVQAGFDTRFVQNYSNWGNRSWLKGGVTFLLNEPMDMNPRRKTIFAGHFDSAFLQTGLSRNFYTATKDGVRPYANLSVGGFYQHPFRSDDDEGEVHVFNDKGIDVYSGDATLLFFIPLWELGISDFTLKPGGGAGFFKQVVNSFNLHADLLLTWTPHSMFAVSAGARHTWRFLSNDNGQSFAHLEPWFRVQHSQLAAVTDFGQDDNFWTFLFFIEFRP